MLEDIVVRQLFVALVVFVRVGMAFLNLPGLGEQFVLTQVRLGLALLISVLVAPVLAPQIPPEPASVLLLALLLGSEAMIGLFIGTVARMLMNALETAGTVIALVTGLSNAQVFNPAMATQGTLPGALLGWLGIGLIFITNLHHLLISAVVDSYVFFPPGQVPPVEDFANMMAHLVSRSFLVGVQMATPFLITGLMFALTLGVISRLAPQTHVFFIFTSIQIGFGLFLFALTVSGMMVFWLRDFHGAMVQYLAVP